MRRRDDRQDPERAAVLDYLRKWAEHYPEAVFPSGAGSADALCGSTRRTLLQALIAGIEAEEHLESSQ